LLTPITYPQGFVAFGLDRLSPIGTRANHLALVIDRSWTAVP
jgi:hypothetical protein